MESDADDDDEDGDDDENEDTGRHSRMLEDITGLSADAFGGNFLV